VGARPANVGGMLAALLALSTLISAPGAASADTSAVAPRRQLLELAIDPAAALWYGNLRAWLDVHRPTRYVALRLHGPVLSRVEMNTAAGAAPLLFGMVPGDTLLIESRAALPPGPVGLHVAFQDSFAAATDTARGVVRLASGAELRRAFGVAIPAWSPGTATPWEVRVHVPAGWAVRTNLRRSDFSRQGGWRTWEFASARPLPAESLRVVVFRPRGSDTR